MTVNLKSLTHNELAALFQELRLPRFRVKQVEQWVYQKGVDSFQQMTNLPAALRTQLEQAFTLSSPTIEVRQQSADGTRKYLMRFEDGVAVETVGIPSLDGSRLTVCFSTQAGCAMGCVFCATGLGGFVRNLTAAEMFDQVRLAGEDFGMRVSNVVAMGQGEPFANYDAVLAALRLMNDEAYLGVGARHITVSTCGLIKGIERIAQEPEQFTLAVSLHSAVQGTRNRIMPGVSGYPLTELRDALKAYGDTTKRRPTLEYAPMEAINDTEEEIEALIAFCRGMLCHVNLIPLNPVEAISFKNNNQFIPPSPLLKAIERRLINAGVEVSVRTSRGGDIDGACGQLMQKLSE